MEPEYLRKKILENVVEKGKKYYFKNQENGDCAMLLENGLCCIQKHTSEQTLCNTCRKYPRIYGGTEDIRAFSMAASCPVVAHAICADCLFLYRKTEKGFWETTFSEVPFCEKTIAFFEERFVKTGETEGNNASCFPELSDELTELFLEVLSSAKTYLKQEILALFSFYEVEQAEKTAEELFLLFLCEQKSYYENIRNAYVPYRIYSAWLEEPEKTIRGIYEQICGELFLFLYFGFLLSHRNPEPERLTEKEWERVICLTYRLTVHEKKLGEELSHFFMTHLERIEAMIF